MKLYEFVDKLYAMGDMESPKTVRSKKTLNESYTVSDELFDKYKLDDYKDVGDIHNEITFNYGDKDLADDVVSRIEVYRNNRDDDDLEEGLGAIDLAKGAIKGMANEVTEEKEPLEETTLGAIGGGIAGGTVGSMCGHPIIGAAIGAAAGNAFSNFQADNREKLAGALSEDKEPNVVTEAIAGGTGLAVEEFYEVMEEYSVDIEDQVEYLLSSISDTDLKNFVEEFKEYMEFTS